MCLRIIYDDMRRNFREMDMKRILFTWLAIASSQASGYEVINNEDAYLNVYSEINGRVIYYENRDNELSFGDSQLGVDARYAVTDTTNFLSLLEGEVNWDAEEAAGQDDLFISKAYLGVQHESLGVVTYGKHSTPSDDFFVLDYSGVFGGTANLRPVSQHDSGVKYLFNSDLFMMELMYGVEAGDFERDIMELFGQYSFNEDMQVYAGVGKSSTNVPNNRLETLYAMAGFEILRGDWSYGAAYYWADIKDNELLSNGNISKNALTLAARLEIIEKIFGYGGYEVIDQDSEKVNSNGLIQSTYIGAEYQAIDWASVFSEIQYADDETKISERSEVNFAVGITLIF